MSQAALGREEHPPKGQPNWVFSHSLLFPTRQRASHPDGLYAGWWQQSALPSGHSFHKGLAASLQSRGVSAGAAGRTMGGLRLGWCDSGPFCPPHHFCPSHHFRSPFTFSQPCIAVHQAKSCLLLLSWLSLTPGQVPTQPCPKLGRWYAEEQAPRGPAACVS